MNLEIGAITASALDAVVAAQDRKAQEATRDRLDLQVPWDQLDIPGRLVLAVLRGLPDQLARLALLDPKDWLVQLGLPALKDLVQLGRLERPALLVRKDQLDQLDL